MSFRNRLKERIPGITLQFLQVLVIGPAGTVLLHHTVVPEDNVGDLVGTVSGTHDAVFLGVLSDRDDAVREARVCLVFQAGPVRSQADSGARVPEHWADLIRTLGRQPAGLPFVTADAGAGTGGVEYWRLCRRHIGHDPLFVPAAGALVTDGQGRFLLQRRSDDGSWGILGGGTELGETVLDTARREVLEESGLEVELVRLLSVATGDDGDLLYPNGDCGKFWGFLFLARVTGGKLLVSNEESLELRWFTLAEIETLENKSLYLEHNFRNVRNKVPVVTSLKLT